MTKKISDSFLKLFFRPVHRRPLRLTLRELHASGAIRVFRRPSILNLWAPLRESFDTDESFVS